MVELLIDGIVLKMNTVRLLGGLFEVGLDLLEAEVNSQGPARRVELTSSLDELKGFVYQ